MKIAVDTSVLVRALVRDEPTQARAAIKLLTNAELIAIALPCLCELVWVLKSVYSFKSGDAAAAIRALHDTANVQMNRPAVEAGLAMLESGGDFADGVIAFEGRWLGGETFVSLDQQAVALLKVQGQSARMP